MNITIIDQEFHRNGVCGKGYHVVDFEFTDEDNECCAPSWERHRESCELAVLLRKFERCVS